MLVLCLAIFAGTASGLRAPQTTCSSCCIRHPAGPVRLAWRRRQIPVRSAKEPLSEEWAGQQNASGGELGRSMRVIEFYSGIGGMRQGLQQALRRNGALTPTVEAYEISTVANQVYEHNHPGEAVLCRSIEHLRLGDVDGRADLWLLSPPCQPYCQIGKGRDDRDPRACSLLHLIGLLASSRAPPRHVALENVPGFEASQAHARLIQALRGRGYQVRELFACPTQLGWPNTRRRFFCLATREEGDDGGGDGGGGGGGGSGGVGNLPQWLLDGLPEPEPEPEQEPEPAVESTTPTASHADPGAAWAPPPPAPPTVIGEGGGGSREQGQDATVGVWGGVSPPPRRRPLSEFLDAALEEEAPAPVAAAASPSPAAAAAAAAATPLLVPPKLAALSRSYPFDVATAASTETTAVTKGYGKHAGRAGPVLLLLPPDPGSGPGAGARAGGAGPGRVSREPMERFPKSLPPGAELRHLSPRELLNLHGFPAAFAFPPGLSLRQQFGLIGNSVNVEVVARLLTLQLFGDGGGGGGGGGGRDGGVGGGGGSGL